MGVARERDGLSEAEAEAWLADLRAQDRYLADIWGGGPARSEAAAADVTDAGGPGLTQSGESRRAGAPA